jgi:hypothetical protein
MVIHIGMGLAAGVSSAGSRALDQCRRDSNWRNRTVVRAKSSAETSETSETSKTPRFRDFREPRNSATAPAETSETSLVQDRTENPALYYTVGKNYLARRAGSAVTRKLKARSGRRSGEEF